MYEPHTSPLQVAADGDIHVYGRLGGRALAGLSGDKGARVFAAKFNAELVSIADVFTTCDQVEGGEHGG
jgi:septum site-determining protein MinC